jgi:hypothetical protein
MDVRQVKIDDDTMVIKGSIGEFYIETIGAKDD